MTIVFRVILGILFMFSATAKFIGMDQFELYVFGFGLFNIGYAFVVARLVLVAEYATGLLLLANTFPRLTWYLSFSLLSGFTGLLLYLQLTGNTDNCHCFGELIEMTPQQSLIKNAFLFAILFLARSSHARKLNKTSRYCISAASVLVPLMLVFTISFPDNWRYDSFGKYSQYNEQCLLESIKDGSIPDSFLKEGDVIIFISLKCEFCKLASRKIALLRRSDVGDFGMRGDSKIHAIIGRGDPPGCPECFFKETGLDCFDYVFMNPSEFLHITNGRMPLVLVVEREGYKPYSYRQIH